MGVRFGSAARNARIEQEVSLKTVADALDFSPAYISDIERGHRNPPAPPKLRRWANVIGFDPDQFVDIAEHDRPSVELAIEGDPQKAEMALTLARHWDHLTDEQEAELMEALKRIVGGR